MSEIPMQPLTSLPVAACRAMRGVLSDLDGTLSTSGKVTAEAYAALERLRDAGLLVVVITGRPAGWCDHIARMWPVSAVVGENGALYMIHDDRLGKLRKHVILSEAERRRNRERLAVIAQRILREVPGSALASDQLYRESDLAIDYCEDVAPLSQDAVDRILTLMQDEGLTAKISSIHVNGWFGRYDKLEMTRSLLAGEFAIDVDSERERFAFVGDSPNDAPMFAFFPYGVGVANVCDFSARIGTPPRYITTKRSGAGFAEFARFLLAART